MSKRSFNPHDCIGPLNTIKQGIQMTGRPFSKESMISNLKGCGLPVNSTFWSVFRNSGIIQEISKGKFMFTSKDPIYVGKLQRIKTEYQELARKYKQSNKTSKVEEVELERVTREELPKDDPQAMTQFAIDLLKEQGYLIFAPTNIEYTMV